MGKKGVIDKKGCMLLFNYSIKHLELKDKVRFYYALKGRDGKSGILKHTNTQYLGKSVILTPIEFAEEIKDFFSLWNLPFTVRKVIVEEDSGEI